MVANSAMSSAQWQDLAKRTPTVEDFKLGPAPAPTPQDTYSEKWLKLVWMEEYCSMLQFKQEYRSLQSSQFNQDAFLSLKVHHFDDDEEAYRCLPLAYGEYMNVSAFGKRVCSLFEQCEQALVYRMGLPKGSNVQCNIVPAAHSCVLRPDDVEAKSVLSLAAGLQCRALILRGILLFQMIWRCLGTSPKAF